MRLLILKSKKGDGLVYIFILIFFIITLAAIVIEYYRMDSLYQQVDYVLRRGVNSSVEYAMLDEYRKDGVARMDSALAEERLYQYFYESMKLDGDFSKYSGEQWIYTLEIQDINATDHPPRLVHRLFGDMKGLPPHHTGYPSVPLDCWNPDYQDCQDHPDFQAYCQEYPLGLPVNHRDQ